MPLNIEDKRQILYATLLQHAPEIGSLRDRVLDRLILVALLGSSSDSAMTVGAIRNSIHVAPQSAGLRAEFVHSTLNRLRATGAVGFKKHNNKSTYYLEELGRRQTDEAVESAAQLFDPVLGSILKDTEHYCSHDDASKVVRTFISECFARFGQQIASDVTGELTHGSLLDANDIDVAFAAATRAVDLSDEARDSLRARCTRFIRSTDHRAAELKFKLTQGYYAAHLLGVPSFSFNPLADDAFRKAIFYLDTNVLVDILLSHDVGRTSAELVRVCSSLDVELRVTRATIDETNALASAKYSNIKSILKSKAAPMLGRIDDAFAEAFVNARNHDFGLTLEGFFERFAGIPQILREVDITLVEKTTNEVIGSRNVTKECAIVQKAALEARDERKTDPVCRHDVCHYLLVEEDRSKKSKAWFLTRDKTLGRAAAELRPSGPPFCFSFLGLLQSVSPFVEAPDAQSSLVDLFMGVLLGEVADLTGDAVFTFDEVKLVSTLHADVLATSPEALFEAYDYVRSSVLKGRRFRDQDHREIALEVRKYLASTRDERLKNLESDLTSEKHRRAEEKGRREHAEELNRAKDEAISDREEEIRVKGDTISRLQRDAEEREAARHQTERRLEAGTAVLGGLSAALFWLLDSRIVETIGFAGTAGSPENSWPLLCVRLAGAVALTAGLFRPIRRLTLGYQTGAVVAIAAVALSGSSLVSPSPIVGAADYLAVITPIVLVVLSMLRFRPGRGEDGKSLTGE